MSVLSQSTIAKKVSFSGVGIHTGNKVKMNVLPSTPNTGIVFKRTDLKQNNIVIPNFENVSEATLCTTVSNQFGVKVSTIEHLMAAFLGLGIDNVVVELDSQEVPILDGSARDFVKILKDTGLKISDVPIKLIKINNKVELEEGGKYISIDKSNTTLEIEFEINYQNKFIKNQQNKVNVFEDNLDDVFNSRTFCLYEDIEKLQKIGLGKGGSLENAIVVKDDKILNENGLRNKNEFVNHKILDCMGDLYLVGYRIIGSLKCTHGGHSLTNKLLRKVFNDTRNYSLIEIKGKNLPHSLLSNRHNLKSIA
ncbi:UDP-3-O-[3-hydroxymyristoyl] N-acetylglucosamine deacetylase [Pelagibacterales bacterium SAG-MED34]|nr:UDP-3-O-[3-hydroxymyristoyl] N-acetylglucosamine deacetylase [Pelagibacterales bacterium SAG-MED34]